MKFQIEKTIEILSQTPDTIKSLIGNLSGEWTENACGLRKLERV